MSDDNENTLTDSFADQPTGLQLRTEHLLTLFNALLGTLAYLHATLLPVERGYTGVRVLRHQVMRNLTYLAASHAPVRLARVPNPAATVYQAHLAGGARVPLARRRHLRYGGLLLRRRGRVLRKCLQRHAGTGVGRQTRAKGVS